MRALRVYGWWVPAAAGRSAGGRRRQRGAGGGMRGCAWRGRRCMRGCAWRGRRCSAGAAAGRRAGGEGGGGRVRNMTRGWWDLGPDGRARRDSGQGGRAVCGPSQAPYRSELGRQRRHQAPGGAGAGAGGRHRRLRRLRCCLAVAEGNCAGAVQYRPAGAGELRAAHARRGTSAGLAHAGGAAAAAAKRRRQEGCAVSRAAWTGSRST